ncbi:MAG: LA_3696 family protein [Moorellaceae bacterium]
MRDKWYEYLLLPEVLRQKLGEDGARELVNLLNASAKNNKEDTVEFIAERIERRLAEMKADIETRISALETRLMWRLFAFCIGQAAFFYGLVRVFLAK